MTNNLLLAPDSSPFSRGGEKKQNQARIKHRLFIVGCPRSGTTLLQSCLANHSEVLSFPESHFFERIHPEYEPKRKLIGMASRASRDHLLGYLEKINASAHQKRLSSRTIFIPQYTNFFVRTLDELACQAGKSIWLEKTPRHLEFVDTIQKLVKQSKIIHILRDGPDVIASLYEVGKRAPKRWSGVLTIDQCIERWNNSIERAYFYSSQKRDNHFFVQYEKLVKEPTREIGRACRWLDIPFENKMVNDRKGFEKILQPHETWKMNVSSKIENAPRKKFQKVFSPAEQEYILQKTATYQQLKETIL